MDLNLDTLKQEILAYLEHSEFAVFRSAPGGLEGLPMVLWDGVMPISSFDRKTRFWS